MSLPCIPPVLGFAFHYSSEFLRVIEELWSLHTSMALSLSPRASEPVLQLHLVCESSDPSHVSVWLSGPPHGLCTHSSLCLITLFVLIP